jgi:POT family proton-dependent oligopeptide transporter
VATLPITAGRGDAASDRAFFGHPRGLSTLFFTEMWERFSYYGMRGFLILYMTAPVSAGGMGLGDIVAGPIYGAYTSMVYFMSLPGGWLADRLLGQRRAVIYGGILIALGHYSLAVPTASMFYLGLVLIVLGTGLLKPNVSVIVGQLYAQNDIRRDAGFSIFYMGINLGATIGPLITGFLAQQPQFQGWLASHGMDPTIAWHFAFGAAGVGMTFGVIQFILGQRSLGTAGTSPTGSLEQQRKARTTALIGSALIVALVGAVATGMIPVTPKQVADAIGYMLVLVTIPFFGWLLFNKSWTPVERGRLWVILVLFLAVALFWSIFEQAGSTLNLFADRSTDNTLPLYGAFPSSWFQSLNSAFIIVFAPIFAWLWIKLRNHQPSVPAKFAFGLIGAGLGFLILVPAASMAASGAKVSVLWLTVTYLFHTWGELSISPVGLSAMTKLAPARVVSLIMGVWFLGASVGNYLGGQMASMYGSMPLSTLFGVVGVFGLVCALLMFAFTKPLTKLMGGVN